MEIIKILVVDDDKGLRDLLQRYLTGQGFEVFTVADAVEMDAFFKSQMVDLLILDLMLPGEDGLSIARRLRANSELPIIILSAKGEEVEKIIGLEMGADDYLAKPFNPRELLARIRAILRRQGTGRPPSETQSPEGQNIAGRSSEIQESRSEAQKRPLEHNETDSQARGKEINNDVHEIYRFGPYALDVSNYRFYCNDQELSLTAGEFNLLHIFVTHANRVLSRDQLMDLMKGYDRSPFDRSIDIRVTRLRKKIEPDSRAPQYIRTIWGTGYLFSLEAESKPST